MAEDKLVVAPIPAPPPRMLEPAVPAVPAEVLATVEGFKTPEGTYDLLKAVQAGIDEQHLNALFGSDIVGQVKQYADALRALRPYKTREGYDLARAIGRDVPEETLHLIFGEEAVGKVVIHLEAVGIAEAQYAALSEKQKKPVTQTVSRLGPSWGGLPAAYQPKPPTPGFDKIIRLGARATEFPKASGFYCYTTTESSVDPTTKETTTRKTTHVYARLEDESLIQIDKTLVVTKRAGAWIPKFPGLMASKPARSMKAEYQKWLDAGSPGYKLVSWAAFAEYHSRGGGGGGTESSTTWTAEQIAAGKEAQSKGAGWEGIIAAGTKAAPPSAGEGAAAGTVIPEQELLSEAYTRQYAERRAGETVHMLSFHIKQIAIESGLPGHMTSLQTPEGMAAYEKSKLAGQSEIMALRVAQGAALPYLIGKESVAIPGADIEGRATLHFVAHEQAGEIREAVSREQFDLMVEYGVLPKDTAFIPAEEGWSYLSPKEASMMKENSPELYEVLVSEGWEVYEEVLMESYEEFQRKIESGEIIPLPDGQYITRDELNKLSPDLQDIALTQGWTVLQAQFVEAGDGEYMFKSDYEALPPEYKEIVDDRGLIELHAYIERGEVPMGVSVSQLEEVVGSHPFDLYLLQDAMRRAGLGESIAFGFAYKMPKWEELTYAEKERVAEKYIALTGLLGIEGEHGLVAYELARARQALTEWTAPEVSILTVEDLDEAVHNFGVVGERRLVAANILETMKDVGIIEMKRDVGMAGLSEKWDTLNDEQKSTVLEHYQTFAERFVKEVEVPVAEITEAMSDWAMEDPNIARQIVKGLLVGPAEMAIGMSVGVGGAVLKSVSEFIEQAPKSAVVQLANVPLGMVEWLVVQTPTRIEAVPAGGTALLVGNLTLPFVIKGSVGGVKSGYRIAQTIYEGGVLPRGYKGGGLDVYRIKVPESFESLTAPQVREIFQSGLSGKQQIAKVQALLNPETAKVYRAYFEALDLAKDFKVSESLLREVDFSVVKGVSPEASVRLKVFLKENPDILVGGSTAIYHQTKGILDALRPGDLDFYIREGSSLKTAYVKARLVEILKEPELFDLHRVGEFGRLPYDWVPPRPIVIDGITFRSLADGLYRRTKTVTTPGLDESLGLMGPKVEVPIRPRTVLDIDIGTSMRRLKDVNRLHAEYRGIAKALEEMGEVAKANRLRELVDFVETAPRGRPLPFAGESEVVLQRAFIEIVRELQEMALDKGIDVSLEHRLGTLNRFISPAGRELRGAVYHATPDIKAYMRTLKEKGYIEAGRYIDEQGNWVKAPREDLFTSPDLAFDRLYDLGKGKIPEGAGVVAIRTVAGDIGRGKAIDPAFRTEYVTEVGRRPYPVVYDELRLMEGRRAYATDPTGFSFRRGSVGEGLTGESVTYHPRAKSSVDMLWFATEEAKRAGLGAPNAAQVRSLNLMAIRAALVDLLHPHLPKRFVATTEPIKGASLIEFRRETYKWKGKPKAEAAKVAAEQDRILIKEATDNLKAKGKDKLPPREYAKALDEELSRVVSRKVLEAFSDKDIQRMLKDVSTNELSRTYYLNLQELYSKLAAAGLGSAGATISELTNADVTTVSTLASRVEVIPTEIIPTEKTTTTAVGITPPTEVIVPTEEITITPTPSTPVEEITPETVPITKITEVTEITIPVTPVTEITEITETTIPVTPTVTPVTPPIVPPPPILLPSGMTEEKRPKIPAGSIAWRQGMLKVKGELRPVWKYLPPPWDEPKPITLLAPPAGAKNVEMRTPRETVQLIGEPEAKVPESVSVDLGVVDIYVTDFGRNIQFKGKGLETDVGKRIVSPTKGMSIPAKEAPLGIAGLKVGTTFAELLRHYEHLKSETVSKGELETIGGKLEAESKTKRSKEALADFVEKRLLEMLPEMSYEEIANELKGQTEEVRDMILSHLPDRARVNVERLFEEKKYIKVGEGAKYAEAMPEWRRMKELEAEALGEEELELEGERTAKKIKKNGRLVGRETLPEVSEVFK